MSLRAMLTTFRFLVATPGGSATVPSDAAPSPASSSRIVMYVVVLIVTLALALWAYVRLAACAPLRQRGDAFLSDIGERLSRGLSTTAGRKREDSMHASDAGAGGRDEDAVRLLGTKARIAVNFVGLAVNETPLLSPPDVHTLVTHLPSRCVGKDWSLLYSTERHGYHLTTLLNRARGHGPTLLVVMDDQSHVFGAFASRDWGGNEGAATLAMSFASAPGAALRNMSRPMGGGTEQFFGSGEAASVWALEKKTIARCERAGESFLFTARPSLQVFRWTRRNNLFMLARPDCIAFGGGGGKFGLFLDSTMQRGSSGACDTFDNAPLASTEMFSVVRVEVWGFVMPGSSGSSAGGAHGTFRAATTRAADR